MGAVFILQGISIYIYGFDHNPPHVYVKSGNGEFTITIRDRLIEGKTSSRVIKLINTFIDEHEEELMLIWDKAQRGEKINKIKR